MWGFVDLVDPLDVVLVMVQRTSFATTDAGEALKALGAYFPKLRMSRPRDDFSLTLQNSDAGVFSVLDCRLVCERSSSAATMGGIVAVGQVRRGGLSLSTGRAAINTSSPWVLPPTEVISHWDEVEVKVLMLPSEGVARFAGRMVGREIADVRFTSLSPRSLVLGDQWKTLTTYITHALSPAGSLARSPVAKANAFAHIASVLLATFPNSALDDPATDVSATVSTRSVRRALAYIDDNAHLPITVDDVAEAAGVSLRSLQYSFRSTLGSTPSQRLRRVRLARAHEELLVADPGRDTVSRIAHQWGFAHVGRFARQYRENYGTSPLDTLRSD